MKSMFFIGFMGVGKTTIGIRLGEILNIPVVDMDSYIEKKEGKTIKEIFNQYGEAYFRDLETQALEELAAKHSIITTGGGVIEREKNRKILGEKGLVFHLTCPFDVVWSRLEGDQDRPLVKENSRDRLLSLYNRRFPLYKSGHSITIQTENKTVDEVIQALLPHIEVE
ncbi:shikimate kinase [Bacillus sp. BHET2]|uniref:shikimate kinase n=1 Tax=Bacillus sp. BHET2 TaxID=2583818 RepID=UPI00110E023F|nr:shikimate kinase [Bacillus sp. BHET2]TMU85468.1 shikimate kinase [Bacillus sp. BHET2]